MSKDERYKEVKKIINSGLITELHEIFKYIPKSVVANDLGKNTGRTYIFTETPEDLTYKDIGRLVELFEVDRQIILRLIDQQYLAKQKEDEKKMKTK